MIVGVPAETHVLETRVALTPSAVASLLKSGHTVVIEKGAGVRAGFTDEAYSDAGARVVVDRAAVFQEARLIAQVRTFGANSEAGAGDLDLVRDAHILVGHAEPMTDKAVTERFAGSGATCYALELIPRITRAQSMDVLSSQANIAGYRAVIEAAMKAHPSTAPNVRT